jgi:hypothetical protein
MYCKIYHSKTKILYTNGKYFTVSSWTTLEKDYIYSLSGAGAKTCIGLT